MRFPKQTALRNSRSGSFRNSTPALAIEDRSGYFKLAIASLIWIFLYRLFPFGWSTPPTLSLAFIIQQFTQDQLAEFKDYAELVLSLFSFAIFGFAITGILRIYRFKPVPSLLLILLLGGLLGSAIELLQAFTPSRNPNLPDILTDALGGGLGWLAYQRWRVQIFDRASRVQQAIRSRLRRLSVPALASGFIGYFAIATVGIMLLPTPTGFSNWDSSFPLMIGNENTGDRPWQGSVGQVQIFDRALSSNDIAQLFAGKALTPNQHPSLIASYILTEKRDRYQDQTGQLPDLLWHGNSSQEVSETGIHFNADHWLQSAAPAQPLSEKLKQNAQMSLAVTLSPESLEQKGPARIISLSQDTSYRNFTLGQSGKDLVFRLRTPITGENGSNPQITVPRVFADRHPHHVVVTYAKATAQVFVDQLEQVTTFQFSELAYKILFDAMVFFPLGVLLGLILLTIRRPLAAYLALLVGGVMLPTLLIEGLLATTMHRDFVTGNLAVGMVFSLAAILIVKGPLQQWLQER
jgi:VanZ family protein